MLYFKNDLVLIDKMAELYFTHNKSITLFCHLDAMSHLLKKFFFMKRYQCHHHTRMHSDMLTNCFYSHSSFHSVFHGFSIIQIAYWEELKRRMFSGRWYFMYFFLRPCRLVDVFTTYCYLIRQSKTSNKTVFAYQHVVR